jgi:sialidase-1
VATEWKDSDGDRYASAGDIVSYTYTLGNAGNALLTGISAPQAGNSQERLAAGDSITSTRDHVPTAADITAGSLEPLTFEASAANGSRNVSPL